MGYQSVPVNLSRLLLSHLGKWIVFALLALILFGVLPTVDLVVVVGLFVAVRIVSLVLEGSRRPMSEEAWQTFSEEIARSWEQYPPEERAAEAELTGYNPTATPAEIAEREIENLKQNYVAPRPWPELAAELVGLVTFSIFIPLAVALSTNDFVTWRRGLEWTGAMAVATSLAVYWIPHFFLRHFTSARRRMLWWVLPCFPALFVMLGAVRTDHPYLNPLHPERGRLAAERVLTIDNLVVAAVHADWVFDYAADLERQGDNGQAIVYYREALRLNPHLVEARERLAQLDPESAILSENVSVDSAAPFWTPETIFPAIPSTPINGELEQILEYTVVLMRIGDVPEAVLSSTAYTIEQELNLPVLVYEKAIPLPPHSRIRGFVTGKQWEQGALIRALQAEVAQFPAAPIKYVMLTPADTYASGANYVFSTTYPWGALISFARYGDPLSPDERLMHRTAKQTLGALLKSFEIPASPNRDCVTSYTRSLAEFDAKGNRPDRATLQAFQRKQREENLRWQHYLQTRP